MRLGLTSFGGPVAHLGYFREEFVRRRRWLTDDAFADCIAITQMLPGPASSQTGMLVGLVRNGWPGAVAAWAGFTLPSAVLMTGLGLYAPRDFAGGAWLHGLLLVAVAVVFNAVRAMRAAFLTDGTRIALAVAVFVATLALPFAAVTPIAIAACAFAGASLLRAHAVRQPSLVFRTSRRAGVAACCVWLGSLAALPAFAAVDHDRVLTLASKLFVTGSLVFGGGHVVLPLLQTQVVQAGIAPASRLIAGYAAAQAIPGPLFTLSSYVGAIAFGGSLGVLGALVATLAIFAPSFLLLAAVTPLYSQLASNARFRSALAGANAGVVGLLAAAFVSPIWTSAIHRWWDVLGAGLAFVALAVFKWPPWTIVCAAVAAAAVIR